MKYIKYNLLDFILILIYTNIKLYFKINNVRLSLNNLYNLLL